jgi:pimeloyl-ACP methyl ester carboxylesterase
VAAFWAGLSGPQRWWLVTHQSAAVGGRDGIAVADRDMANRLLLESERDRLLALRADGDASGPLPMVEIAWVDGQLRGIGAIEARLRDPALPRAYLLGLSTVDDGRAVIAVGNPDQASDVLTYIPGAGSDLSGVDTLVRRADALGEAAARVAPHRQVSVIAWLGYDPPDGVGAVMAEAGHDAEPALDAFADGLRATHGGERSHNTVLGHSYGSLVAGVTARDRGLDADDLVFVGSPGVGVDRAADLGLSPRDVWSSTAANDPVQRFAPGWGQFVLDAAANAAALLPLHFYGDATPDLLLWHGLNPSTPAFGGNVFASDPDGGHDGYWQGAALTNIARIALNLDPATSR